MYLCILLRDQRESTSTIDLLGITYAALLDHPDLLCFAVCVIPLFSILIH